MMSNMNTSLLYNSHHAVLDLRISDGSRIVQLDIIATDTYD